MEKIELLSPVGNMEMFYQAVHNGADAVYLAGEKYGARKFAENFTRDKLKEVFSYARLYGVKVYVTINTLIYETEIEDFISYVEFLYKNGVDAVIMQDIGMMSLVHERFPNLEIHASTQCHNHNQETVQFFKNLGVTRVVLAREMSLEEIKNISVDIEKEVFVYGALCVCYSGCCLFSSLNGGRSGNRGECVGSCRLPYKLIKNNEIINTDGKYLLSTKELNTLSNLEELLSSGIDSLKIEGRMKSPAYVGYVTKLYRILIDKYYNHEPLILTNEEQTNLKKLYNREFTKGYLFQSNDIMNIKTPNHQGIRVAEIISTTKDKIKIRVINDSLNQQDGIRFKNHNTGMMVNRLYNEKNMLVNQVTAPNIAYIDNIKNIKKEDIVLKTIDYPFMKSLEKLPERKVLIDIYFEVLENTPMKIRIEDGTNKVELEGMIPEIAINRSTTKEEIEKQLKKLGNTPYKVSNIKINMDNNLFINIKAINELRRNAIELLTNKRLILDARVINKQDSTKVIYDKQDKINLSILVRTEEQLKCAIDNKIDNIYVTDYNLYHNYKDYSNLYYRVPRINTVHKEYKNEKLLITEIGSMNHYKKDNNLIGDYYLNITNHKTIELLTKLGLKKVTLSVELSDNQIKNIMKTNYPVELIVYGRLELMVMKYCPLKKCLNYCNSCKKGNDKFYLEDNDKNRYPLLRENCITHILHHKVMNKIENISYYQSIGIKNYRIELFDENYSEVNRLIKEIKKVI